MKLLHLFLLAGFSACTYGQVTDSSGAIVQGAQVTFHDCKQRWSATTDAAGYYSLNPYNERGEWVNDAGYVPAGRKLMTIVRNNRVVYATTLTIAHKEKCSADWRNKDSEQIDCQRVDARLDGAPDASSNAVLTANLFYHDCTLREIIKNTR